MSTGVPRPRNGKLTIPVLEKLVEADEIDTVILWFPDHLGRLMGKRLDASFFLSDPEAGTHGCDYLLTCDYDTQPRDGFSYSSWDSGYGDFHMVPDMTTLTVAAWLNRTAFVICDIVDAHTHIPVDVAPRSILAKQVDRARLMGFDVMAASELEHYLYHDSFRQANEKHYHKLTPTGWLSADYHMMQGAREEEIHARVRRALTRSGVPVESCKGETGLGQAELNVKYANVMQMADRHMIFKQAFKEVCDDMGKSVTFMAKPHTDQPGSSCHIHLSLWKDGKNAFGNHELQKFNSNSNSLDVMEDLGGGVVASSVFKGFLGGWMKRMKETTVMYAPTVNSYKRFKESSWAPTSVSWSGDNRTSGFRVVGVGSDKGLRIECRIPGADANPYLAFAASLAAGLDGIEQGLAPPPVSMGNVYDNKTRAKSVEETVPSTLKEAAKLFEKSKFARKAFGDQVVEHYAHHFDCESRLGQEVVTDWERARYFEQV